MKILEVTAFSAGFCGVWTRVLAEASLLSKHHEVTVFSSNIYRGAEQGKCAPPEERIGNLKIRRFKTFFKFGGNTYFWDFSKEAIALKPDLIIVHVYRQYYSTNALKIAEKLGIPCILVTHAPFLDKKIRSRITNLAVYLYDLLIGRKILNKYSKILAITRWEMPYLRALGAEKEKLEYIPNGIPEQFFRIKIRKPKNKIKKILFLGRLAPIKDISTLIRAFSIAKISRKDIELDLAGPIEEGYKPVLDKVLAETGAKVNFLGPVNDLKKKIALIDSADIFVLSSLREGMPQALIEGMSRQKLVISSKTDGGKEIVKHMKTGLLFDIGNENSLAKQILFSLSANRRKKVQEMEKCARAEVRQFAWPKVIKKIEKIISEV